ncbi:MAG: Na+/H+ antiporter NhaC family protein [Ruminococcus sp.]|nr:Na+/H+ antiporter NhaC family protein [Ruminococcus sp.]
MESVYVGWLSILPPIIAILLALITKEVLFSLITGVLSGAVIYSLAAGLNPLVGPVQTTFDIMIEKMDLNIMIFCFLLGALVFLVNASGGAEAYGRWTAKVIRTKRSSLLFTSLLGCLIFLDDYFNCLTVGTVMKPVTDRHKVSRAKLAYIIDATAAPICIIAPISSWAAAVGSYLKATGAFQSEFSAFVSAIPYNFYALLSLLMVLIISIFALDFGPLKKCEALAEKGDLGAMEELQAANTNDATHKKGTVADMIVPIIVLIIVSIAGMLYNGGYWSGDPALHNITAALGNCVAAQALVWGSFAGLLVALVMYISRKIMTFAEFMENVVKGMQQMITSGCILVLAWAIGGICRDLLSTPDFVKTLVETTGVPGMLLPTLVFVVAAFLSFATGTSWGTFGILIPIIIPVAQAICPELLLGSLAATLAGSVFGDHCSPISDTTILSSAGAGVSHLVHVSTQMIYALTVAGCSMFGYIVLGITGGNLFFSLGGAALLMIVIIVFLNQHTKVNLDKQEDLNTMQDA